MAIFAELGRVIARVVPVVLGVVTAVFFILRLVPGDPAAMILGERATPESLAQLRQQLGLTEPLGKQYLSFLWGVFTRFDTGNSLVTGEPSRDAVLHAAPLSLSIVALAVVFAVLIAVPLAVFSARQQHRVGDHAIRALTTIGLALPTFWVGLLLIIVFAVQLQWLPVGGVGTAPGDPLRSLTLPALTVALGLVPPTVRSLRGQLLEILSAPFHTTLRVARISEQRILWKHTLRNALLPTLTLFSVNVSWLIGGTLVIEKVFAINGIGALMFHAISTRDFPVVQAVALFCAVLVVLTTTCSTLLAALLDPRLRRRGNTGGVGG